MLNEELRTAFANLPGINGSRDIEVLQCSSATATGAIIFHISARTGRRVDAIVKTPRDPAADHAIAAEWDIVSQLCRDENFGALVPAPLHRFELDGATFYAYRGIAGRTMFAQFRNRLISSRDRMRASFAGQALDAALHLHSSHSRAVGGEALAEDLRGNLANLRQLVNDIPSAVESSAMMAAQKLADSGIELPAGRIHGDFSPYNLISESHRSRDCSGIIDWEYSEPDRPQHLDVFRFISGCELMGRRSYEGGAALLRMCDPSNPAARVMWGPWLTRMSPAHLVVATQPAVYGALWTHFFFAAAYREQRRQANPADIGQSTYFRGLLELAAMSASAPHTR